jgi:hypothetical protein
MRNFKWGLVFLLGSLACVGGFGFLALFCWIQDWSVAHVFEKLTVLAILPMFGGPIYFWAIRPLWRLARAH